MADINDRSRVQSSVKVEPYLFSWAEEKSMRLFGRRNFNGYVNMLLRKEYDAEHSVDAYDRRIAEEETLAQQHIENARILREEKASLPSAIVAQQPKIDWTVESIRDATNSVLRKIKADVEKWPRVNVDDLARRYCSESLTVYGIEDLPLEMFVGYIKEKMRG